MTEKLRALALAAETLTKLRNAAELAMHLPWEKPDDSIPFQHKQAFRDLATPEAILALLDEIDKLKADNAGLRKDAERLDYMDNTGSTVEMMPGYPDFYPMHFRVGGMLNTTDPSLRNAIDAAIDAAKGDSHE